MTRRGLPPSALILVTLGVCLVSAAPAFASFGIERLTAGSVNRDGSVDLKAGSHPYEYRVDFAVNNDGKEHTEGTVRDLTVDLPAGMVGDPLAVPRCTGAAFEGFLPNCPVNTQIGIAHIALPGIPDFTTPVYNMTPPRGVPAAIGLSVDNVNGFLEASLRPADYGVRISDITFPTEHPILSVKTTIWGVPADPGHDSNRGFFEEGSAGGGNGGEVCGGGATPPSCSNPSGLFPVPFLTLPSSCTGPLATTLSVDSLQEPGVFQTKTVESLGDGGAPEGLAGCDQLPFHPSLTAQPETGAADSPTGLKVDLHLPQNEAPEGLATADLKNTTVTLPPGLVANPSAGGGRGACSLAQIELHGPNHAACPDDSKIGTVLVHTPLIDHPLPGAVYLAKQVENPFGSLLALYVTVDDPVSGVVVKLAGKIEPDPVTGRLTTTLAIPQLPFEDAELSLFGGPRGVLTTPATCGTYTTTSDLTPWTTPQAPAVFPSDSFQITTAAGGGAPCLSSEAQEPNSPSFQAGTVSPLAGSYSPFVLKLSREDGSQRFAALNVTLPPGLTGKLAGVAECSEAQLAAAAARTHLGEGALELAGPSCPASSQIGTLTVGAGSGAPLYVGGHAYLAGPYKGAPFSIATITPAVAGPFDLGSVLVRAALYIDPDTAQVTVKSDPLPTILDGVPLDERSIEIDINRPEFNLNPTSCEPMVVTGQEISTLGQAAALSSRFQAAGCQGLPFKPSFTASTQGKASKANGASLTVKVSQTPGQANIRKVNLQLPIALPSRLTTLQKACTEAQFNANPAGCPEASFIGTAKATTPLLATPLTGPAILVSHGGAAFPDVEFLLQGEGVHITLDGKTDIKNGVTYSRFETVPDAPISSFETVLPQGPHSILGAFVKGNNNYDFCAYTKPSTVKKKVTIRLHGQTRHVTRTVRKPAAGQLLMPTTITAQNGAQVTQTTRIAVTGCPAARAAKRAAVHTPATRRSSHR